MECRERGINLHIVRSVVSHDSRVQKETETLARSKRFASVKICGFHEAGYKEREILNNCEVWRVSLKSRPLPKDLASQSIKYAEWYVRILSEYKLQDIRVIHCHALAPLPIAVKLKKFTGAKLVYDAHELQSETHGSKGLRKLLARWSESRLTGSVDAIIAVSPSICDWYAERFPDIPVSLLRNIPEKPSDPITPQPLRTMLHIPDDALLFTFIGGIKSGKGIEQALEAFENRSVPHHLLFLGKGPLLPLVQSAAHRCKRIHYLPPVTPREVLSWVAGSDVSICITLDTCLSRRYSLPNKLFESLLAGVPVVASQLPELSRMILQHDAGWLVPAVSSKLQQLVQKLTVQDVETKKAKLLERVEHLHWANESKSLIKVYDNLPTLRLP